MENPRGCILVSRRWVGLMGCRCIVANVLWKGNGAKALDDWIVTNSMERVSGATVRTASRFSMSEVNADKKALTGNDGWGEKGFEVVIEVGAMTYEVVIVVCGRKA